MTVARPVCTKYNRMRGWVLIQAKDAYMEMVRKIETLEDDAGDAATTLAAALAALPPPSSCM
jgi:hypothetical protein